MVLDEEEKEEEEEDEEEGEEDDVGYLFDGIKASSRM